MYRKALQNAKKFLAPKNKIQLLLAVLVLLAVFSSGSWAVHQAVYNNSTSPEQQKSPEELSASEQDSLEKARLKAEQDKKNKQVKEDKKTSTETHGPEPEVIKYSISSDPRSTAYSTTPPKPKPGSFEIKITHNGQVAPGTMISYNANKGAKTYYCGDLKVSPSKVTLAHSAYVPAPITISSPDGKPIGKPAGWDQSTYFFIAYKGNDASAATHNDLIVEMYNNPKPGIYQLHIAADCAPTNSDDGWIAGVFIAVEVVD